MNRNHESLVNPPRPARWWRREEDGRLLCTLCPRFCRLSEGQAGFCYIRQNRDGAMVSLGYGRPTGFAVDPIEKKPLHHFLPGTGVLSFGTAGCNLGCKFCQNWSISKAKLDELQSTEVTPASVVDLAEAEGCPSIAYTYNDPVIFGEFVVDVSREARERGLRNVMVTAGYITPEARPEVFRFIDAVNVDLKAFSESFYRKVTLSHLDPVLDTLRWLHQDTGIWHEVTTLIIPGLNDSEDELRRECEWLVENLGPDVPLHLTAFHPDYRMQDRPATPVETLERARRIALDSGLHFVYLGNVFHRDAQTTACPTCGTALVERDWHRIASAHPRLLDEGVCFHCKTPVPGVWY